MEINRNSRIVRWAYSPPVWDTPCRESVCVLFWRSLAVPIVWAGVVGAFVIIILLPGFVYTAVSWLATMGLLAVQGVPAPDDFYPGTFWWDTIQTLVVSGIFWALLFLHDEEGWFAARSDAPGPEIRSPTWIQLAVMRAKAAKRKVCPIIDIR